MSFWDNFKHKEHLIVAHRGANAKYPENTMIAFKEALGKCDFIELDVTCSKDGVIVVIHDDTLERTTNAKEARGFAPPYNVIDYNYEELLELDFRNDQKIPTLQEVLWFCKTHNLPVNVEIKDLSQTPFHNTIVQDIVHLIQKFKMEDLVLLSSYLHTYLSEALILEPRISRAALQEEQYPKNVIAYLQELQVDAYNIDFEIVDLNLVKALNDAKIIVNVYTVNNAKQKAMLFKNGIKAIFTDVLE